MENILKIFVVTFLLGGCVAEDRTQSASAPRAASEAQTRPAAEDGSGFHALLGHIQGAMMSGRPSSLCYTIKRHNGGAGLYRVVSMESFMEENEELKALHPKTYVKLERLEAWSVNAPKDPIARINGGAYPDGIQGGFIVTLTVGEKVGLMLDPPSAENLGFYSLHQEGVFNEKAGRYSNERLFTKQGALLTELSEVVRARADLPFDQCRKNDVRTDMDAPNAPEPMQAQGKPTQPLVQENVLNDALSE